MAFEQSYGRIDGDSASSTELFVLISSLAKAPIKQGIAVTGSINQNGEIQAIGGVNEKIEGFFEVCRIKGFTGEQGVVIPRSTVSNLMLSAGVRKALTDGRFHIWAIDHVEDGLKVLTGEKAGRRKSDGTFTSGSLFDRVQQQMREFSRRTEEYRKKQQNGDKNGKPNNKKAAAAKRPAKKR